MQLYRLPQVLVLHLVRFAYGAGSSGKVNKPVAFSSSLRLKPNMLSDDCPDKKAAAQYRLIATVSHHGRTLSGGRRAARRGWAAARCPRPCAWRGLCICCWSLGVCTGRESVGASLPVARQLVL